MIKKNTKEKTVGILLLSVLMCSSPAKAEVFYDFDNLPPTAPNEIPKSGGGFLYTTESVNPDKNYTMTLYNRSGWRSTAGYPDNDSIKDYFFKHSISNNSSHLGFENYGYLEIDDATSIKGNSLRYRITGGKNYSTLPNANGLQLHTKKEYLDYLADGHDPVQGNMKVGVPYIYFSNTSNNNNPVSFWQAKNTNQLSIYVKLPAGISNGAGGFGKAASNTVHMGPYSNVPKSNVYANGDPNSLSGGHWYHQYYTQGGGWTHFILDGHPQHSNTMSQASQYPYPSSSFRNIGTEYFNNMHKLYWTAVPYDGIAVPGYSVWIDEIEFQNDPEPQNSETIGSPSVLFLPDQKIFEIGFNDKYKNNAHSYSTYEVRYSFAQITNANWNSATPVHIQADSRYGISASTGGKFKKWWPYYQAVWAPFRLAPHDEFKLTPGTTVYFAIKDVSQENGNSQNPVGGDYKAGRRYADFPNTFDYAGDQAVLNLIKRIDYLIANPSVTDSSPPSSPKNLVINLDQ